MSQPRISLCIPTFSRKESLSKAVESGLREVRKLPPGTAELLVSDNASYDETLQYLAHVQANAPELMVVKNAENLGFDRNYLRCLDEARGEVVWVMGDDDVWLPGSVARVLRAFDEGADMALCLSEACNMDMVPQVVLPWFLDPEPKTVFDLRSREDLIRYFDGCARNAGVFAFISATIFRRERYLKHREALLRIIDHRFAYVHVCLALLGLQEPTRLHYIPEVLIQSRLIPDSFVPDLYERWMQDLRAWAHFADRFFGDDPELHRAFSHIVGRNHHNTVVPGIRMHAHTEARWAEAVPFLLRAGFSELKVQAADLAYRYLHLDRPPSPHLDARTLCLADLGILTRGARRIGVLAVTSLDHLFRGSAVLHALRPMADRVRVLTVPEGTPFLEGFDVQVIEPNRYGRDLPYREAQAQHFAAFAPDLVINLDRNREVWGDDLLSAVHPPGALGFCLPPRGQDAEFTRLVDDHYHCLLPNGAPVQAIFEALGLAPAEATLWPPLRMAQEAARLLQGWSAPREKLVALFLEDPGLLELPAYVQALDALAGDGYSFLALTSQAANAEVRKRLAPLADRCLVLAGVNPGLAAALLGRCGRYLGGSPLQEAMAEGCGCQCF